MSFDIDEMQEMDEHFCCPECGSANIETKYIEDKYGQIHVVNKCLDCHFDWEEYP